MKLSALASAALAVGVLTAQAEATMLVDFSNSVAVTPTLGGTWNTLAGPPNQTYSNLVNADNTPATGVSMTLSGFTDFAEDQTGWNGGNDLDWVDADATRDYFWVSAQTQSATAGQVGTITISGLPAGSSYEVSYLGVRKTQSTNTRIADITVNGAFTNTDISSQAYDAYKAWNTTPSPILTWTSVALDSSGDIVIKLDPRDDLYADKSVNVNAWINALRITPVPEPSSLGLLALGGIFTLRRRRRGF